MIPFIFFITLVILGLITVAFTIKDYTMGLVSAMGLSVVGVYYLIYGAEGITNILSTGLGIICVAIGVYIFIGGSLQKIEEVN